jgi:hypothetical protein
MACICIGWQSIRLPISRSASLRNIFLKLKKFAQILPCQRLLSSEVIHIELVAAVKAEILTEGHE